MTSASEAAAAVLGSVRDGHQIVPFTDTDNGFDLARAGETAVAVARERVAQGERIVGCKLGFTNRTIWEEYGVYAPIWGPVYDATLRDLARPVALAGLFEPRIEPEIMLRLSRAPEPGMTPDSLMDCVGAVGLGFEVVQSVFPGWKFRAPDTVAAFALHGILLPGPFVPVVASERHRWRDMLADFSVTLEKDGAVADKGQSANVLGGGPLAALAALPELLGSMTGAPVHEEGAIVSTGTLTRALPIRPGETWEVRLDGLPLGPARVHFA